MSTCARPRTRAPFLYLAHSCSWRNLSCIHFLYSCSRSFSWDMRTHTKRHTNEVPTHSSCASCKCRRIFAYANSLLTALCVAMWTAPVRKSSRFLPRQQPYGSPEKLSHEICLAAYDDLPRFETQKDIARAVAEGTLHAVESLHIAWPEGLPVERRVLRVWAHAYLTNLARRAGAEGITLRVTSLTRPVELQKSLARRGATPAHCNEPLVCGTHATGAAFDISTRTLSVSELSWIANELMTDMKESRILFILEARGAHFHIFVPKPQP